MRISQLRCIKPQLKLIKIHNVLQKVKVPCEFDRLQGKSLLKIDGSQLRLQFRLKTVRSTLDYQCVLFDACRLVHWLQCEGRWVIPKARLCDKPNSRVNTDKSCGSLTHHKRRWLLRNEERYRNSSRQFRWEWCVRVVPYTYKLRASRFENGAVGWKAVLTRLVPEDVMSGACSQHVLHLDGDWLAVFLSTVQ